MDQIQQWGTVFNIKIVLGDQLGGGGSKFSVTGLFIMKVWLPRIITGSPYIYALEQYGSSGMIMKPHLYNFGLFLAGMIGCSSFPRCPKKICSVLFI